MAERRHHRPDFLHRCVSAPAAEGLSAGEVSSRMSQGLANRAPDTTSRSLWEIVRANVLTLFNAIVGTNFVVLLLLGSWQDALFGLAAVGNAIIGVVQECRAKRSLDRPAVPEAPLALVLREGSVRKIPTAGVVLDDVLVLRAGDQVTADAFVLGSRGLEADESLLTGESDPVDKDAWPEVRSGSIVVAGRGAARVIRVEADSFSSRIAAGAKRFPLVNSEIRNSLNRVLRWLARALIPVAPIVANGGMQSRGGWAQAIASGTRTSALAGYGWPGTRVSSRSWQRSRNWPASMSSDSTRPGRPAKAESSSTVCTSWPGPRSLAGSAPQAGSLRTRRPTRPRAALTRLLSTTAAARRSLRFRSLRPGSGVP